MNKIRLLILSASALAAVALFAPAIIRADEATLAAKINEITVPAATPAPVAAPSVATTAPQPELPAAAVGVIDGLVAKFPWLAKVLSIYAAAAIGWQLLVGLAHNWAARTTDLNDDQWVAKLDTLWWFKILDRFFYFGGYAGAYAGGKKL
jgi:hypothetical protein